MDATMSWAIFRSEGSLPDEATKISPADDERVNVSEEHEIGYWCRKFGVTPAQLRAAGEKVGDLARRVETELKRR